MLTSAQIEKQNIPVPKPEPVYLSTTLLVREHLKALSPLDKCFTKERHIVHVH